jgi:SAM-dependent methyltransferase
MKYDHKQSLKEVIKHVLLRCRLIEMLDLLRRLRGRTTAHMQSQSNADIFSRIYADGVWIEREGQESLSGSGSTRAATQQLVVQLSDFLREVGCRRLVDIGCGDFNWMKDVTGDFDYIGIDVVPSVIAANNAAYANERRRFSCFDAVNAPVPTGDVALCREVLFHLSFVDGMRLLGNIKAAGFKFVLLTQDHSVWFNSDIRNGDFRKLNLRKAPFRLPPPQRELASEEAMGRVLAVWLATALPPHDTGRASQ